MPPLLGATRPASARTPRRRLLGSRLQAPSLRGHGGLFRRSWPPSWPPRPLGGWATCSRAAGSISALR
eukprot:1311728-Alexandrium_andersonii.AAC.1